MEIIGDNINDFEFSIGIILGYLVISNILK